MFYFWQPGQKYSCFAGDLLQAEGCGGRGAEATIRLREGAAAPVRSLLPEVGELPFFLGQHALGPPRGWSVSVWNLVQKRVEHRSDGWVALTLISDDI